ncbi:K(+)/H(+) antiporter 1 [Trichomonascus vanleenenianus]|uniref:Kha1p n=1 Tax=Trichomonascus vanleenenianus TaxID=2268995 RepID=UPI003EC9AEFB
MVCQPRIEYLKCIYLSLVFSDTRGWGDRPEARAAPRKWACGGGTLAYHAAWRGAVTQRFVCRGLKDVHPLRLNIRWYFRKSINVHLSFTLSLMANSTNTLQQTGVLGGRNPIQYSPSDPLTLFLVQSFIIIVLARLIHWPLSYLRQPRVISEVVTGIILGPSVMGHVPNFTNSIFPTQSMSNITTVANLGLIMFLFMVGMEVDLAYVRKNLRVAVSVGFLGMIFPFALGWAVALGIYDTYGHGDNRDVSYAVYGLFVAVALAITALPVLARILTELRLLRDRVGVIVLSAGIGNDLAGWILLALSVTLANNSRGINTLYVILLCVAWFLLLYFVVKPILRRYLLRFGGIEKGPSQIDVSILILLVMVSAFYTDIIGVHPIFGAFLMGIIVPRDNDFVVRLTEKIEDFVTCVILPQYFALAGLSCNIGLLNDGTAWGYVIALIAIAFIGKFVGGTLGARFNGLLWRESSTAGILMSCKGIVEIVVLTVGLSSHILTEEVFTMFIVMTLVTTFLTTPLTVLLYPEWYRLKVARWRKGEINWDGTPKSSENAESPSAETGEVAKLPFRTSRFIVSLDSVEAISVVMTFIQLLSPSGVCHDRPANESTDVVDQNSSGDETPTSEPLYESTPSLLHVFGIRLIELTQRTADLIQATSENDLGEHDPILAVVNTFTAMHRITFTGKVAITPLHDRSSLIVGASTSPKDFLFLSWHDPIDEWENERRESSNLDFAMFKEVFRDATCNVGLFVDRGFSTPVETGSSYPESAWSKQRRIYVPYFEGPDDKLCVGLALQLAENPGVHVTLDVISRQGKDTRDDETVFTSRPLDYVYHVLEGLSDLVKSRIQLIHSEALDIVVHVEQQAEAQFKGGPTSNDLIIVGRTSKFGPAHASKVDQSITAAAAAAAAAAADIFGGVATSIVGNCQTHASILVCQALESAQELRGDVVLTR